MSATIEQLAKPAHPEAYGLFLGGKDLADPAKRTYTYFVVRGTGEYLVKVMTGSKTTTVTNWTANENIPKEDANGKATYALKVHVAATAFHFFVNGKMVAEVPKGMDPVGWDRRAADQPQPASAGLDADDRAVAPTGGRDAPAQRQRVPPWGRIQRSSAGSPAGEPGRARPDGRLIERFVGELEGPPMDAHHDRPLSGGALRVQVAEGAHRFLRVHVHDAHEPARVVGADRHQRDVEGTVARADLGEVGVIAAVAGEVDAAARRRGGRNPPRASRNGR